MNIQHIENEWTEEKMLWRYVMNYRAEYENQNESSYERISQPYFMKYRPEYENQNGNGRQLYLTVFVRSSGKYDILIVNGRV